MKTTNQIPATTNAEKKFIPQSEIKITDLYPSYSIRSIAEGLKKQMDYLFKKNSLPLMCPICELMHTVNELKRNSPDYDVEKVKDAGYSMRLFCPNATDAELHHWMDIYGNEGLQKMPFNQNMKTKLPESINTVEEAKALLTELDKNGESFHPEDDAHDIEWNLPHEEQPNKQECDRLNKLMEDIYNLDGNAGNHASPKFDPCEFLNKLTATKETTDFFNKLIEKTGTYFLSDTVQEAQGLVSDEELRELIQERDELAEKCAGNDLDIHQISQQVAEVFLKREREGITETK